MGLHQCPASIQYDETVIISEKEEFSDLKVTVMKIETEQDEVIQKINSGIF